MARQIKNSSQDPRGWPLSPDGKDDFKDKTCHNQRILLDTDLSSLYSEFPARDGGFAKQKKFTSIIKKWNRQNLAKQLNTCLSFHHPIPPTTYIKKKILKLRNYTTHLLDDIHQTFEFQRTVRFSQKSRTRLELPTFNFSSKISTCKLWYYYHHFMNKKGHFHQKIGKTKEKEDNPFYFIHLDF